ncbi:MAG: peptidoglycan DD-metalloendopeptidase family protein [Clostridiales bacterium]|nr:peptidoglycan DD-metalloendopeptidase family protein [Clostridiales bacterium]
MKWLKRLADNKAAWADIGPMLVFGLLIYCMIFVSAERPYPAATSNVPLDYAPASTNRQALLAQDISETTQDHYAEDGLGEKKASELPRLVDAWTISVDNTPSVYLASLSAVEMVLERVKESNLPDNEQVKVLQADFVEPLEVIGDQIPITALGTQEEAFTFLTESREAIKEYTVSKGESYWSIARKHDMTVEELVMINAADINKLQIGDILKLNTTQPLLSVMLTIEVIREEDIPFGTTYRDNADLWEGQNTVYKNGVVGKKAVTYEVAQINGLAVEEVALSEEVLSNPVDRIMNRGTKYIAASRSDPSVTSSAGLSWPAGSTTINSRFGSRGRGFHGGIDIKASSGDPIYSAAAGTVISAARYYDYGNRVVIDHGNGLATWYAHLQEIKVSVGQVVGHQELIGLAGTTGRVTGPHLHFEVRIDGQAVNPEHYLR